MDTVILDGVQYIKATEAAKQFDYTSDYVGQLCRGKKVDARLVGRTWFVNPESLQEHKTGAKPGKPKAEAVVQGTRSDDPSITPVTIRRRQVEPVLGSKASRSIRQTGTSSSVGKPTRNSTVAPAKYEVDTESLLPPLQKPSPSAPLRRLVIEYPSGRNVRVRGVTKPTSFQAGALPDIALSGEITVEQADDIPKKNNDISETQLPRQSADEEKAVHASRHASNRKKSRLQRVPTDKEAFVVPVHTQVDTRSRHSLYRTDEKTPEQLNQLNPAEKLVSRQVKSTRSRNAFTSQAVAAQRSDRFSMWVRWSPLIATVVATVGILLLFSASTQVVSDGESRATSVVFQLATLLEVLR